MGKSSKLTASLEDYIEAIADLSESRAAVRSSHIAERLGVVYLQHIHYVI